MPRQKQVVRKEVKKQLQRYIFGTTPSYDALLKALMLRFADAFISGDRELAERTLLTLAGSLRKEMKEQAKEILEKYYEAKEEIIEEYENKPAKFIDDEEEKEERILEKLYEAYSKLVDLMDEYQLLVREWATEDIYVIKR